MFTGGNKEAGNITVTFSYIQVDYTPSRWNQRQTKNFNTENLLSVIRFQRKTFVTSRNSNIELKMELFKRNSSEVRFIKKDNMIHAYVGRTVVPIQEKLTVIT